LENTLTRICLVYCSADFKPSVERDVRKLNSEVNSLTSSIESLRKNLGESKSVMAGFAAELSQLRETENETRHLEKTIILRKKYLQTLREEFQLKRMNKGAWWRVFINSFRRE